MKRQSLEPTPAEEQLLSPSTSKKSSTTASTTGTSRGTTTKSTSAKTASSPNVPVCNKSDETSVASTLAKIPAKQLCEEVEKFIESWVQGLDGDQPTEAQEQDLKQFICTLDQRVQQQGIDQPNSADGNTENKTDDEGPIDNIPDTSKPTTLLELAYYILQSFDNKQLQELKLRDLSEVSINLF